jgi:hypothetical protein
MLGCILFARGFIYLQKKMKLKLTGLYILGAAVTQFMEPKQLIDKFEKGEIDDKTFQEEVSKLDDSQMKNLDEQAKAKLPEFVQKLVSVRKGTEKIASKQNADKPDADVFGKKLRDENFDVAKSDFFAEVGMSTPEEQQQFLAEFEKFDTGSVTPDNIKKDFRRYYASLHADELFNARKELAERAKEAEEFIATGAGAGVGGGTGGGNPEAKKYSKEIQEYIKQAAKVGRAVTPEQAQRNLEIAKRGNRIS